MEDEIVTYRCGRPQCTAIATKTMPKGVLGIMRKPPYPKNWKQVNKKMLCPECAATYAKLYAEMWMGFLKEKPLQKTPEKNQIPKKEKG